MTIMPLFGRQKDDNTPSSDAPHLGGKLPLTPLLGGDRGAKKLVQTLDDARKRPEAINRLIAIGDPAIPHVVEALSHRNRHIRDAAAFTLGRIGNKVATAYLVNVLLEDDAASVRKVAGYALGVLEDVRAVPALIQALRDINEQVVEAAIYALGRIDLPEDLVATIVTWEDEIPSTSP